MTVPNDRRFTVVKRFGGFSCAHRQWRADGSHCRFVHGYDRHFEITFACNVLDRHGWVVDFGGLKPLRDWLDGEFDHVMQIAEDDPLLPAFRNLEVLDGIRLRVREHPGMEGAAARTFDFADDWIGNLTDGRVWVERVVASENDKNRVEVALWPN